MAYSTTFKSHLSHPHNVGELANANAHAEQTNPSCGDRLQLSLFITNGRIVEARYLAYGCPPTLVCGSVLTDLVQGKTIAEALLITREDIEDAAGGIPSRKRHAAALAIETLLAALESRQS